MKNLTLSLPDALLDRLKASAGQKKMSVNRFVREILNEKMTEPDDNWRKEHEALLEELGPLARHGAWSREEIYAERLY